MPIKETTLYVQAFACNTYEPGPEFAEVVVDNNLVARINHLAALATEHGFTKAVSGETVERWHDEDDLELAYDEMKVYADGDFCFAASPEHGEYEVETKLLNIDQLVRVIEAGPSPSVQGSPFYFWMGDVLLYSEGDRDEFLDALDLEVEAAA